MPLEQIVSQRGPPRRSPPRTIPAPFHTPLIGREQELQSLVAFLHRDDLPLITLVGPAGVGKTRLALAAAEVRGLFSEPPTIIDLADVRDPAFVLAAVRERLGMERSGGSPLWELRDALATGSALVVLDNFEHVLAAAVELPGLLTVAPNLKLLVTSRAPLGLTIEQQFPVAPLTSPDLRRLAPAAELVRVPSIALFVARASARVPGFAVTETNARTIAELCIHLDGLPLAIELATARISVLSPEMILEHLKDRLSLLRWEARDLPQRQQTLVAALDYSYDMLSDQEQALFRRLAVFAGGFDLDAVEAVTSRSIDGGAPTTAVDLLESLVDNSLVVGSADPASGRRFRLLESIRDYALRKLSESGDENTARRAHALYFVGWAEQAAPELLGRLTQGNPRGAAATRRPGRFFALEQEQHNLRVALEWLASNRELELGLRLATIVATSHMAPSDLREACERLEPVVNEATGADPHVRLRAMNVLGFLLAWQGEIERAQAVLADALTLGRDLGDSRERARSVAFLGYCAVIRAAWDEAESFLSEALSAAARTNDGWVTAFVQCMLGTADLLQGRAEQAVRVLRQAVSGFRALDEPWLALVALTVLGRAWAAFGDRGRAVKVFRQGVAAAVRLADPWFLYVTAARITTQFAEVIEPRALTRLLGAIEALRQAGELPRAVFAADTPGVESMMRARLGQEQFEQAYAAGRTLSPTQTRALVQQTLDRLAGPDPSGDRAHTSAGRSEHDHRLSVHERETLDLIAQGLTNKAIAGRLFLSERTVKYRVTSLFNKLGVNTRAQGVAAAARCGLL